MTPQRRAEMLDAARRLQLPEGNQFPMERRPEWWQGASLELLLDIIDRLDDLAERVR